MKNNESKNSMIRWKYQGWLENAEGLSESTIRAKLRAITIYEDLFKGDDFANYNPEKAKKYKEYFDNKIRSGEPISEFTYKKYLKNLQMFLEWLCKEPGYRSKISNNSLRYLNPNREILAIASGKKIQEYPSIEHVVKLVNSIKGYDEVSMRNRALISLTLLTGMRAESLVSLPLMCIDLEKMIVIQDPQKGVRTKFSKTIYSIIFNFNDELLKQITLWYNYLKKKGYKPEDPLFPKSRQIKGKNNITYQKSSEVIPEFWKSTASMRDMFIKYALDANLKYYSPHTFRHSCSQNALEYAQNGAEIKAVSQNFGHEKIGTLLSVYGQYTPNDLVDRLQKMTSKKPIKQKGNYDKEKIANDIIKIFYDNGI